MNLIRKALLLLASCGALTALRAQAADYRVASPDGTLVVDVRATDSLTYAVSRRGTALLEPAAIGLRFAEGLVPARGARIVAADRTSVDRVIPAPFHRQSEVAERYNQLRLTYDGGYAVTFRVFDEGCAYRFETAFAGERTVVDEIAEFRFAGDPELFAACSDGFCNAFQFCYDRCRASEFRTDKPVLLPLAADWGRGRGKALICESDLESYPGMFLTPDRGETLRGLFAALPDSCYLHERRCQERVATRHDCIARVEGTRTYPWRIVAVADEARELPTNDLVYALGAECRVADCSWIEPGKVAWEWWNDWGLTHVDFEPGIDTRTYKAYIDFAAAYGLEYVVLDEGWSDPKGGDVMTAIPAIDLTELVRYADERGVGLILWAVANVLDAKLEEACAHYAALGIKGFKVDFIDRDDQLAVERVYRLAEAAAAHRLTLDIHGVYKPTGLDRTYPNILNFEGVFGLEELKWSNPDMPSYDVTFPFIRMVQGPGRLYARRLPQRHARGLRDRLLPADESGHAGPSGGRLRGVRHAAGDALRLALALHRGRTLHAVHRLAALGLRPHAGALGRDRRAHRHGAPQGRGVVRGRHDRLDAAHARGRPFVPRARPQVPPHDARRRQAFGRGARTLCAPRADRDLEDPPAHSVGPRRRLRAAPRARR